jgi:transcriptional regulator with XRE-family HTH domain
MSENRPKKQVLAEALAAGKTQAQAAELAGVSPSTVKRWLKQPGFAAFVETIAAEKIKNLSARLAGMADKAATTIDNAMDDGSAAIRLRAATTALDKLIIVKDAAEYEARLTDLEQKLEKLNQIDKS